MVDRTVIAAIRLVRLHNGIIAALGVLVGAWWAAGTVADPRTAFAAASAVLLASFANAFNDLCDVEIDRVAHPSRPLPREQLSARAAARIAWSAAALGVVSSGLAWPALAAVSCVVIAAMALYSARVKRAGVFGNLLVAVLASLPFLYGTWSVGAPSAAAPLLVIGIPLHFAREVAKDLDDAEGDVEARWTLPLAYGAKRARAVVVISTIVAVAALAPLMLAHHLFAVLVTPAVVLCAIAAAQIARGRAGGATLLKTAMVCAMLSLLVTRSS